MSERRLWADSFPLPLGEGLRLAERSDAPAERVRVGCRCWTHRATAHADCATRPSSVRLAATRRPSGRGHRFWDRLESFMDPPGEGTGWWRAALPLPVGEGLRLAERSDAPAERVRVACQSRTHRATAHADCATRPSSVRFAATFSHREKEREGRDRPRRPDHPQDQAGRRPGRLHDVPGNDRRLHQGRHQPLRTGDARRRGDRRPPWRRGGLNRLRRAGSSSDRGRDTSRPRGPAIPDWRLRSASASSRASIS